jgi:hypothetical protein
MNAKERMEAWRVFNEWEASQPIPDLPMSDVLARISQILDLAEQGGPFVEAETLEEKVQRLARARAILSRIER